MEGFNIRVPWYEGWTMKDGRVDYYGMKDGLLRD
jgi:hypothetical protein